MARTKPAVRVHLSVADHDKTSAVWAELAGRAMLVELWRQAGEKWAGKRDNQVPLKPTDRMAIACSTDLAAADSAIETLCKRLHYGLRKYPNRWVVTIRNFARKNGFDGKELNDVLCTSSTKNSDPPNPSPIPIPNPSTNPIPKEDLGSAPAAPRTGRHRSKCPCPDELGHEESEAILAWAIDFGIDPVRVWPEWEAMRDFWRSKGETRLDWPASFRTWLRNSVKFSVGRSGGLPFESVAQGKVRRTKEAGAQALEALQRDPFRQIAVTAGGPPR